VFLVSRFNGLIFIFIICEKLITFFLSIIENKILIIKFRMNMIFPKEEIKIKQYIGDLKIKCNKTIL
jgi:hypothetical protein